MARRDQRFLPLDGGPFRHTVGLRRIDPVDWLEVDEDTPPQLAERARIIDEHHDDVVVRLGSAEALVAVTELRDQVRRHLALTTTPAVDPLLEVGLAIADDVCLLDADTHVVMAGVVCFANRWRLTDKLGLPLIGVHAPVPGYADDLAAKVERVLHRLGPQVVLERRNWGVLDDPTLHQPKAGAPVEGITVGDAGDRLWARVERQTLRRLPSTGAVVFTIRTRQVPLRRLGDEDRVNLAAAMATVPPDTAEYKGLTVLAPLVLEWAASERLRS
ncbi:MAG TPA: DUF3445 domain-containing protein [Acidimicrobiales bacterium]|nr:DUF3445 domain-containing protein [Acidimicrobiales bacterium]